MDWRGVCYRSYSILTARIYIYFDLIVFSFMIWSDWGHKTIQRASLNGENIKILINDSLNFVNGLTIDYINNRIYWVDAAFDKIESSTLNGDDRKKINVDGKFVKVF